MKPRTHSLRLLAASCVLLLAVQIQVLAQSPSLGTFTYQGRLNIGNGLAGGLYDFQFALFPASTGTNNQVDTTITAASVPVSNGLFTVELSFPLVNTSFNGSDRWLEIAVRPSLVGSNYVTLTPRQQITATPYAITAGNLSGTLNAANITGTINLAQLPPTLVTNGASGVNLSGSFTGNGAGVTNLNFSANSEGLINLSGGFMVSASPAAGSSPYAMKAADVNGDGKVDLICANFGSLFSTLTVLTNNGGGDFAISSTPGVRPNSIAVEVADVNMDGKPDLISASLGDGSLTVLTNNGAGGFDLSSTLFDGYPNSVVAADMNGDGKLDLVSPNWYYDTVLLHTNNGSGAFVPVTVTGAGDFPRSAAIADVNLDGRPDIICANFLLAGTLTVLTNNGSGGFGVSSTLSVGSYPHEVRAVDINGDGVPDLISPNYGGNTLSVLTNNGSGGFALQSTIDAGVNPTSVEVADVDNDGRRDLICAFLGTNRLTILINHGPDGFWPAPSPSLAGGSYSVVAADVNEDGKIDLIRANATQSSVSVLLNVPLINGAFFGSGSALTDLDAGNITSGVLGEAQIPNLDATKITSGTLDDARLSANVAVRLGGNSFSGNQTFNDNVNFGTNAAITGNVNVSGTLSFGTQIRQMLNLWSTNYGIGVQASSLYFRCNNGGPNDGFIWYKGGAHNDGYANAGGGTELMHLTGAGLWVAGTFVSASDRNLKENFKPVDARAVLDKVAALPLSEWNYKEDTGSRHLGPMAQDFYVAFGVGPDDKHITTVDEGGVALAAIQGLNQKLETENAALKARLEKLERLVESLTAPK